MDIPNSYRIMKLTNGDNIICEIKNSTSTRYRVKRPMTIKTTVQFDAKGNQRDYTILRNWMNHSDEIETNISTEYVITILKPSEDIVFLYEKQKDSDDIPFPSNISPMSPMEGDSALIDRMLKEIKEAQKENQEDQERDMLDEKMEMIIMSLALPFDQLKKMIENEIIDKDDLKEMLDASDSPIEKISEDQDTTNELHREDFGTKWTDWSLFPEDYLNDEETEGEE